MRSTSRLLFTLTTLLILSVDAGAEPRPTTRHSQLNPRAHRILMDQHGQIETRQLKDDSTAIEMQRELRRLRTQSSVRFAVVDQRRYAHAVPSDALYPTQWFLQGAEPSAIDATSAWDTSTGGTGTVVAVLDTGVRFDHPDLQRAAQAGKLLPGFDFVSGESTVSFLAANDGDGWDADPSDPGDWIDGTDQQLPQFTQCTIENSSWHGTRVAGLIGAASNNGIGIAGASWGAYILPVRVLGKCGGFDSDILPAMRWAAGIHVSGVPDNPYPAKILNLSFGSAGICDVAYQTVIQELAAIGVLVVVSAGNESGPVDAPANCPLAVGVAGVRHAGTKVGYSSLGPEVALAAPAGNCVNVSGPCLFSLHTTYDVGRTIPAGSDYTNQFNRNLGTSFSAPLVAGVAALMHAVNGRLSASQLRDRLRESARPFPSTATRDCPVAVDDPNPECNCTTATCGAGLLHASGAVIAAQRPIANITAPTNFAAGSLITLNADASVAACNRTVAGYTWTVIDATGTSPPVLVNNTQATLQVSAPLSGSYTLRVTITDNQGATDSGDVIITSTSSNNTTVAIASTPACPAAINVVPEPTPAPPPTSTPPPMGLEPKSGGGGALTWQWLVLLMLASVQRKPLKK